MLKQWSKDHNKGFDGTCLDIQSRFAAIQLTTKNHVLSSIFPGEGKGDPPILEDVT